MYKRQLLRRLVAGRGLGVGHVKEGERHRDGGHHAEELGHAQRGEPERAADNCGEDDADAAVLELARRERPECLPLVVERVEVVGDGEGHCGLSSWRA